MNNKLSVQQVRFVEGIEAGMSLVDAYMNAGYKSQRKTAYQNASALIRNPKVIEELDKRMTERKRTAQQRLSSMIDGATNCYIRILKLEAKSNEKLLELQRKVAFDVFDRNAVKPKIDHELVGSLKLEFVLPKGVAEDDI